MSYLLKLVPISWLITMDKVRVSLIQKLPVGVHLILLTWEISRRRKEDDKYSKGNPYLGEYIGY